MTVTAQAPAPAPEEARPALRHHSPNASRPTLILLAPGRLPAAPLLLSVPLRSPALLPAPGRRGSPCQLPRVLLGSVSARDDRNHAPAGRSGGAGQLPRRRPRRLPNLRRLPRPAADHDAARHADHSRHGPHRAGSARLPQPQQLAEQGPSGVGIIDTPLDLVHNYWGVFASLVITGFPFSYLLTLSYLTGIDPSLEQAAATLGRASGSVSGHVMLPLLAPDWLSPSVSRSSGVRRLPVGTARR